MTSITRTLSADGQTDPVVIFGDFQVHTTGTYGGGTTVLQKNIPGIGFETLVDTDNTVAADDAVSNSEQNTYRIDLSGSTTPTVVVTFTGRIMSPEV